MENKIEMNILEIIKKCPIGTKLYSPICGECELDRILDNTFNVASGKTIFTFLYDGRYSLSGECCIFPSKENRDWNKFQIFNTYKNGDVIYFITETKNKYITIFKNIKDNDLCSHAMLDIKTGGFCKTIYTGICYIKEHRLSTEEEKETLFEQIENNSFEWNEQTKTLEKLIKDKFDITTLKPFDKVLVRNYIHEEWNIEFFRRRNDEKRFETLIGIYNQCIPYESNEHLLHKTDECDNYYKNW